MQRHHLTATGNGRARRFPRATVEVLQERLPQGVSVETTNQYQMQVKAFCNWLVKDRRLAESPLRHLEPGNVGVDRRHDRRELTADELTRLLTAARNSERTFRGLTGTDRYHLYALACGTGFRASSLASLTRESFDFAGESPTVTLGARYVKNRKTKVQPLPPDIAELLQVYLPNCPSGLPVWGGTWARDRVAAQMLRHDLKAAGIPYVVNGADGPLFADFHALRHSYLTLGGRSGIDLRTLQELAGHSTPELTARYSHRRLSDLAGAVGKLPNFLPQAGSPVCTGFVQTDATSRDDLSQSDREQGVEGRNDTSRNPVSEQGVAASLDCLRLTETRAGDEIRTRDVQLGKPDPNLSKEHRTTYTLTTYTKWHLFARPDEVLQGLTRNAWILHICPR